MWGLNAKSWTCYLWGGEVPNAGTPMEALSSRSPSSSEVPTGVRLSTWFRMAEKPPNSRAILHTQHLSKFQGPLL